MFKNCFAQGWQKEQLEWVFFMVIFTMFKKTWTTVYRHIRSRILSLPDFLNRIILLTVLLSVPFLSQNLIENWNQYFFSDVIRQKLISSDGFWICLFWAFISRNIFSFQNLKAIFFYNVYDNIHVRTF